MAPNALLAKFDALRLDLDVFVTLVTVPLTVRIAWVDVRALPYRSAPSPGIEGRRPQGATGSDIGQMQDSPQPARQITADARIALVDAAVQCKFSLKDRVSKALMAATALPQWHFRRTSGFARRYLRSKANRSRIAADWTAF
jgi:hypothetical protein